MLNTVEKEFWFVWGERGSPRVKHLTEQDAITEARRLSTIENSRFYVLKSTYLIVPSISTEICRLTPSVSDS
jgi:peroxiredoxin